MPLYEYACQNCRQSFELLLRAAETPECPHCESRKLEKLLSVPVAHSGKSTDLPLCPPMPGTCGRPACGSGGCQFD